MTTHNVNPEAVVTDIRAAALSQCRQGTANLLPEAT